MLAVSYQAYRLARAGTEVNLPHLRERGRAYPAETLLTFRDSSTVDVQYLAGDERCLLGGEVAHRGGDVGWPARATHRRRRWPVACALRSCGRRRTRSPAPCPGDGVYRNAVRPQFAGQRVRSARVPPLSLRSTCHRPREARIELMLTIAHPAGADTAAARAPSDSCRPGCPRAAPRRQAALRLPAHGGWRADQSKYVRQPCAKFTRSGRPAGPIAGSLARPESHGRARAARWSVWQHTAVREVV